MCGVVDSYACDNESDRWHMEAGRVIGIGMPDIDSDDIVAFKFKCWLMKSLRNGQTIRDQSRETVAPVLNRHRLKRRLHCIDYLWRCDRASLGETIAQQFQAKEMIRVPMSDIDGRETSSRSGNPICKLRGLLVREMYRPAMPHVRRRQALSYWLPISNRLCPAACLGSRSRVGVYTA